MIKVALHSFDDLDAGLEAQLRALRDGQSVYDSPFFDIDFAEIVSRVRSDVRIALAFEGEALRGYWALHVRPDKWARPIGAPFSDWHGPVMQAGFEDLSAQDFLTKAGLKGMTASSFKPTRFAGSPKSQISGSGLAYMPDGAEAYLANMKSLHTKHYKNLRRAERIIERDFERVTYTMDDPSLENFNWLMAAKSAQYRRTGKHDVLGPDWVQAMMETLRTERFTRVRGRLSTLSFDGQLIAAEFNLLSDKIVHGWITVYDPNFSRYSPGHMLMKHVICDMENTGHEMCDVGTGSNAYRKYYENVQQPCHSLVLETGRGFRPFAGSWHRIERSGPAQLKSLMASMRRRGDQIFACELGTSGRLAGLKDALRDKLTRKA